MDQKQQVERHIFETLAPLINIRIVSGSIRQGNPPLPDIECETEDQGFLAVELVALDDKQTRTRIANMRSTEAAWDRALLARPDTDRATLQKKCCDLHLAVVFDEHAGMRDRVQAMSVIQARLLQELSGFTGPIGFTNSDCPRGLRSTIAYRDPVASEPHFATHSVGTPLPPQIDTIREKLTAKHYQTQMPLDLFAYSKYDQVDGAIGVLEQIDDCVHAHLADSRFRRVHIFDLVFGRHLRTYP
ncbi:MAG: hypothetical protein ACYDEV_04440 [Acidiferrobacter sp.]